MAKRKESECVRSLEEAQTQIENERDQKRDGTALPKARSMQDGGCQPLPRGGGPSQPATTREKEE